MFWILKQNNALIYMGGYLSTSNPIYYLLCVVHPLENFNWQTIGNTWKQLNYIFHDKLVSYSSSYSKYWWSNGHYLFFWPNGVVGFKFETFHFEHVTLRLAHPKWTFCQLYYCPYIWSMVYTAKLHSFYSTMLFG